MKPKRKFIRWHIEEIIKKAQSKIIDGNVGFELSFRLNSRHYVLLVEIEGPLFQSKIEITFGNVDSEKQYQRIDEYIRGCLESAYEESLLIENLDRTRFFYKEELSDD